MIIFRYRNGLPMELVARVLEGGALRNEGHSNPPAADLRRAWRDRVAQRSLWRSWWRKARAGPRAPKLAAGEIGWHPWDSRAH